MSDLRGLTAGKRVRFRVAGYLFTYRRATGEARVRIDMWREDPATGERHWISVAACAPTRQSARSVALALAAWARWCDVGPRRDIRSQAVAESFALMRERIAVLNPGASCSVRSGRQETVRAASLRLQEEVSESIRDAAA
jgi:hypothetical protein